VLFRRLVFSRYREAPVLSRFFLSVIAVSRQIFIAVAAVSALVFLVTLFLPRRSPGRY
jgi:hypothetical protein